MEMKQSFSTSEVAAYCHVTADTIRKWAEAGRIRVFKTPGGHRRIRREDLILFLRENGIPLHTDFKEASLKILVIDAEKSALSVIQRFLERTSLSFVVQVASDCFEAGRQMAMFQPDVVFLDLRIREIDGVDLCRRIKAEPEYSSTRIIAMAPADDGEVVARALQLGASAGLPKPFSPDDLRRALASLGVEAS